jgi:hypothetical protein
LFICDFVKWGFIGFRLSWLNPSRKFLLTPPKKPGYTPQ